MVARLSVGTEELNGTDWIWLTSNTVNQPSMALEKVTMWLRKLRSCGAQSVFGLVVLAAFAISGCAAGNGGGGEGTPEAVDPTLQAAADAIEPELRENFADVFSGLTVDHDNRTLVVYRIPDAAIEAQIRELAEGVAIEFRDAAYSLNEMQSAVEQVAEDSEYWRGQGVDITAIAPEVDGSGIVVHVVEASSDIADQLRQRYDEIAVSVREGAVQPPTGSAVPTITLPSDELETEPEVID